MLRARALRSVSLLLPHAAKRKHMSEKERLITENIKKMLKEISEMVNEIRYALGEFLDKK